MREQSPSRRIRRSATSSRRRRSPARRQLSRRSSIRQPRSGAGRSACTSSKKEISNTPEGPALDHMLEDYAHAQERFEHLGGYELDARARQILAGLGFPVEDFDKPAVDFSGGWQMRIALSKPFSAILTCCSSTSRQTTSTSRASSGSSTSSPRMMEQSSSSRTTALSWTPA